LLRCRPAVSPKTLKFDIRAVPLPAAGCKPVGHHARGSAQHGCQECRPLLLLPSPPCGGKPMKYQGICKKVKFRDGSSPALLPFFVLLFVVFVCLDCLLPLLRRRLLLLAPRLFSCGSPLGQRSIMGSFDCPCACVSALSGKRAARHRKQHRRNIVTLEFSRSMHTMMPMLPK